MIKNQPLAFTLIVTKKLLYIIFLTIFYGMQAKSFDEILIPRALQPGDKIAVLSPSGPVESKYVDGTVKVLRELGYVPVIYPTAYGKLGYFSAPHHERFADLRDALLDPSIRAIICTRGGYGMVHSLNRLDSLPLREDPKWIIGYSDISALHALMHSKGIASVHASMGRVISKGMTHPSNQALFEILKGEFPEYEVSSDPRNHPGEAEGILVGGNLAVLQALINTPFDIFKPGTILFIEDVSEPIYKIERMLHQLRLAGILDNINGLIIGQFTEYESDALYEEMEDMIAEFLKDYPDLPVAFNVPIGHIDDNMPVIESGMTRLEITPDKVIINQNF